MDARAFEHGTEIPPAILLVDKRRALAAAPLDDEVERLGQVDSRKACHEVAGAEAPMVCAPHAGPTPAGGRWPLIGWKMPLIRWPVPTVFISTTPPTTPRILIAIHRSPVPDHMPQAIVSRAALRPNRPRRASGFTLIEIMIVVAIITILAAIAIPSYRDYVLRGRLVDATNLLATFRGNMERYYQDNRTYAATGAFNPPCSAAIPAAQRRQGDATNYFEITCLAAPTATQYTLVATGYGTLAGFAYSVTESDVKATVSLGAGWAMPAPNTCWAVKRGQSC